MKKGKFIYLYEGYGSQVIKTNEIVNYLQNKIKGIGLILREEFINYWTKKHKGKNSLLSGLANDFAKIRIKNPVKFELNNEPLHGEIEYELRRLKEPNLSTIGILYDGFIMQEILKKLIVKDETSLNHIHIIITNQLIGTWDENDLRYHARTIVCGFPTIISLSGLIEAPAKPRAFYIAKQKLGYMMQDELIQIELKKQFRESFIDYGDPRMTDVLKGYILQGIFFQLFNESFCEDKNCGLYNAHWQEEMIHAQIDNKNELCERHKAFLMSYGDCLYLLTDPVLNTGEVVE